jgi:hypothetical protein
MQDTQTMQKVMETSNLAFQIRSQTKFINRDGDSETVFGFSTGCLTAGVTGGWGEKSWETRNCQSSETSPKNAPSPSRPVHAVLGRFPVNHISIHKLPFFKTAHSVSSLRRDIVCVYIDTQHGLLLRWQCSSLANAL